MSVAITSSALPLGEREVLAALRREAHPLTGDHHDYDALFALAGDARIVLLGEASHGTHEFYRERIRITKRLISERGFTAVAIEGDWPDAYRVHRFVSGARTDPDAQDALMPAFPLCPLAAGHSGRALSGPRLERAIGVIYHPQTERQSHWFAASAARQYDALVHVDTTRAVEPLERTSTWQLGEPPETYPSAL